MIKIKYSQNQSLGNRKLKYFFLDISSHVLICVIFFSANSILSADEIVCLRSFQAKRSILIEAPTKGSMKIVTQACEEIGAINNVFHYVTYLGNQNPKSLKVGFCNV